MANEHFLFNAFSGNRIGEGVEKKMRLTLNRVGGCNPQTTGWFACKLTLPLRIVSEGLQIQYVLGLEGPSLQG
jgi:hypothetical protein